MTIFDDWKAIFTDVGRHLNRHSAVIAPNLDTSHSCAEVLEAARNGIYTGPQWADIEEQLLS